MLEIQEIDNSTFARAVVMAFNSGQHDPSFGEVYSKLTGESDGELFNLRLAQDMRQNVAHIKDYINAFGVGVVVLSNWYYSPIYRANHEASAEQVMPPNFRDAPPEDDNEADMCLAATGQKRIPFGFCYAKTKNPGLTPIILRAQRKDAKQAAGRTRTFVRKVADSYLADQITQEEAQTLLALFDSSAQGDPNDPKMIKRQGALREIGAVLPKLITSAAA